MGKIAPASATTWILLSLGSSLALHAAGITVPSLAGDWSHANLTLHSFLETAGSAIGIGVAALMLVMNRLGRGSSFNLPIAFGLVSMAVLDAVHAAVPLGEPFVWLHSTATFTGGAIFAIACLPRSISGRYAVVAPTATTLLVAGLLPAFVPGLAPRMIAEGDFTPAAIFLNVGGGSLMALAAIRLLGAYRASRNSDDLLFAVHCLLFGGAAIMFQQSQLWDFSWWWWHGLRLLAYAVALAFGVETVLRLQTEMLAHAQALRSAIGSANQRADEAAREAKILREALDEHTLMSITDRSGKIIDANTGFCATSGYTREELLGETHRLVNSGIHPKSFWVDMWKTIASGKPWRGEVCNRSKEGDLYWVDATNVPCFDAEGNIEKYVSLRVDITDRKRADEQRNRMNDAFERQTLLLNSIMDGVSDGIIATDERANVLLINRAAGGILSDVDYNVESLFSVPTAADGPCGTRSPEADRSPLERAIEGETIENHVVSLKRRDGETSLISCSASPLDSESLRGAVVTLRDVTEHEQLRDDLQQARKLESIGQLAAGIAHEINTPMQCVATNLDFLTGSHRDLLAMIEKILNALEGAPKSWDERRAEVDLALTEARFPRTATQMSEALDDSGHASEKIVEIVRAMKAMSHPGTQEPRPTDVNEVIEQAITISRNRWKYAAEMSLDLDPQAPAIPALAAELSQVFLNLVVNAADAIIERYGEGAAEGRINVRSRVESPVLRIEVQDNGVGVPDEIREKLFDPFFTTKQVGKGTGQGLAITYDAVVNKHGGTIDLFSTAGEGTTFVVCLPLDDPAKPTELSESADGLVEEDADARPAILA